MSGSKISAISYALPENRLTHADLCARFGTDVMNKIVANTGILERRISPKNVCTSDLAFEAAQKMFSDFNIEKSDIDLLIFATQTPDYLLPSTSCIMQDRLGLSKNIAAFDLNLGCTQYTYAMSVANGLIASGMFKKALVLAGDTPSKVINPKDKSTISLFGDAAIATILEKDEKSWFLDSIFGTDGGGYQNLILPTSGFRHRPLPEDAIEHDDNAGNIRCNNDIFIDGFKIFTFAFKTLSESVQNLLDRNGLGIGDIDLFVFHQAGEKIIRSTADRLQIPQSKLHYKLHDIGNVGGSSVGIALADAYMSGKLRAGMKIVLASFGVGLSWNAILLEWGDSFLGASTNADFTASPKRPDSQL